MADGSGDAAGAEVDALLGLIERRYGERLDARQKADVRRILEGIVGGVRALRAAPLAASDEPYPPFLPHRIDG
jgi:hypothetical protein